MSHSFPWTAAAFADAIEGVSPTHEHRAILAVGLAVVASAYLGSAYEKNWSSPRREEALMVARALMADCLESVGL